MPEKISWTINVQVIGGPKLSASQTRKVEAYDMIQVEVPGADGNKPGTKTIDVQPGGQDKVEFLIIKSNIYDDKAKLTYSVEGGVKDIELDALQVLIGNGAVTLLGDTQKVFTFTNKLGVDNPAIIEILVGRCATK